ncbi:NAD-dependent epimerase/dehydratase family protein [Natronorubrum sulfidifaciens]|uniref:UDP-glucose 4-epimerase n=1 Tax=Natronorubrum sulfidifaciens JCM 14089 TaxID=1230460 RepID=L9VYI9_9EURY|nr:NAD-dependent epimerase/dehydratase family protein [Natronorubrum sulfidifaciens]ELY42082.1 UDP-glucose 4-epimerase [Natronorubrum sulfidifaciens JCM 14089]
MIGRDTPAHSLTGQTITITGGAGFIGSRLAATLAPDNDVRILDDLSTGTARNVPDEATLIEGDVRTSTTVGKALDGADLVFHEAANPSVSRSIDAPLESHSRNVEGTLTVLEAARSDAARVVTASSTAVYGTPETVPVAEDADLNPSSPYGLEKLTADRYTQLYNDLYDLPTVSLRYFNVYGPGQTGGDYSGVISIFLEQATADEPITVDGDGQQTRDFVHVDDVIRANIAAATTEATGEAFNVGTGTSVTITELAETIRELTDADSEIEYVDSRPGDIRHSRADLSKASRLLDYAPEIGLEDGLRTLLE